MNEFLRIAAGTVCLLIAVSDIYLLVGRFVIWRWVNAESNAKAFKAVDEIREVIKQDSQTKPRLNDMEYLSTLGSAVDVSKLEYIERHFKKHDFELMALLYSINKVSSSAASFVRDRKFWNTCSVLPHPLTYEEHQSLETIRKELFSVHHRIETFKMSYGKFFNVDGTRLIVAIIAFSAIAAINFIN